MGSGPKVCNDPRSTNSSYLRGIVLISNALPVISLYLQIALAGLIAGTLDTVAGFGGSLLLLPVLVLIGGSKDAVLLAAIIPFVETGGGEDTDCRGLIQQVRARYNGDIPGPTASDAPPMMKKSK